MNDTKKEFLKRLFLISFLILFVVVFFWGVAFEQVWAKVVFLLAFFGMFCFLVFYWICSFINDWRIMGVLTPKEYKIYKAYKPFSSGSAPGVFANKCKDPEIKRIYNKASTAKRITIFDD